MNAEEKQPSNILANQLQNVGKRISSRGAYIYGGLAVLVIAAIAIVYVLRHNAREAESQHWLDLDSANTEAKLRAQSKETKPYAMLDLARWFTYHEGLNKVGTAGPDRVTAITRIEEGRKIYLDVVNDLKDSPMLQQEAWIGAAKAEEFLSGVPQDANAAEFRGSISTAINYYKKAAEIHSDSPQSKHYAKTAADLTASSKEVTAFYQKLDARGRAAKAPFKGGFPGLPSGFGDSFPPDGP